MTWHPHPQTLDRYRDDELEEPAAFSIEAHLTNCGHCQQAIRGRVAGARLDDVWSRIADHIDAPVPGPTERLLRGVGVPEHLARLVAGVPALTVPWLAGVALVLGFAASAAHLRPASTVFFLSVAAVLPLAGVATAYGPGIDPLHELGLAAPIRGAKLLLIRAATVLVTSSVISGLAASALPGLSWLALAWLLPSLALVLLALAVGTFTEPVRAAVVIGASWFSFTGSIQLLRPGTVIAFGDVPQLVAGVVALVSAAVLVVRRGRLDAVGVARER